MQQNQMYSTGSVYQNIGGYFSYLEKVWTDIQEARKLYRQLDKPDKYKALELIFDYEKQLYRSVKYYMEKNTRKIKVEDDKKESVSKSRIELIDAEITAINEITKNSEFNTCSFSSTQIVQLKKHLENIDEQIWLALGESGLLPKKGYSDGNTW
jgi:Ribonuclease G/E